MRTTLFVSPFSADRIPAEIRELGEDQQKSYADLFDIVKKEGGVTNWVNQSMIDSMTQLGCNISHVAPDWQGKRGDYVLSGEVLTVVRDHDLAQVAFRVKLNVGRTTLLRKIYSATIRPDGTVSLTKTMGLDGVIRRPFVGQSNNKSNKLLSTALATALDSISQDLKKSLPYLGIPQLQPTAV